MTGRKPRYDDVFIEGKKWLDEVDDAKWLKSFDGQGPIRPAPILVVDDHTCVMHDAARDNDGYGNQIPACFFVTSTRRIGSTWLKAGSWT